MAMLEMRDAVSCGVPARCKTLPGLPVATLEKQREGKVMRHSHARGSDEPNTSRERLGELAASRTIILVGAGNIGARVAWELPLIGVKRMLLIDPDRIAQRNMACCFAFATKDTGKLKVTVLADGLRKRFTGTKVIGLPIEFNRVGLAGLHGLRSAFLVGAVDGRLARYQLAEAAMLLGFPLVDLGIAGGTTEMTARAQVTWWPVRPIDPLNAWTTADWGAIEQTQPCAGRTAAADEHPPIASSVSGATATALGIAAVSKLLAGDTSDVGYEVRIDLLRGSMVRCALPKTGLSPLDPAHAVSSPPVPSAAATLGALLEQAEQLVGSGAEVALNRAISARFACRTCHHIEASPGPLDSRHCPACGNRLTPMEPTQILSRDSLGPLNAVPVGCLGVDRDLLRITSRDGQTHVWIKTGPHRGDDR